MTNPNEFDLPELRAFLQAPTQRDQDLREEDEALLRFLKAKPEDEPEPGLVRLMLPDVQKLTKDDWNAARRFAREWFDLQFTVDEARAWLAVGARPRDAVVVDRLIAEGIAAEEAAKVFVHPKTGNLTSILAIGQETAHGRFAWLGTELDEAMIERKRQKRAKQPYLLWDGKPLRDLG